MEKVRKELNQAEMRYLHAFQLFLAVVVIFLVVAVGRNYSGISFHDYIKSSSVSVEPKVPHATLEAEGFVNETELPAASEEEIFMEKMKQRQEERKALIRQTCERFDIKHNISHMMPMMLVDEKYKVIHCSMGKTGTTRWKELFWQLLGNKLKDFTVQKYRRTKILDEQRQKFLLNPDWIQTITVREPFERMISAYRQKLEAPGPEFPKLSKEIRAKYGPVKDGKLATFSDFINYLVLGAPESLQTGNEHWTRFTYPCTPCAIDYDFIGHQETIGEDARYFLKLINAPEHIQHGPANKRHTDDEMSLKYYSTVVPRERLVQLYTLLIQDYIMFGYPPPVALKVLLGKGNESWQ